MALKLCKVAGFVLGTTMGTETVDEFSTGDNSDPITLSVTLDNTSSPTTLDTGVVDAKLFASQFRYTNISITTQSETANIDWKISINGGANYLDTVTPADLNALASNQASDIKFKAVVANTGVVATGIYTSCKVKITATENPE